MSQWTRYLISEINQLLDSGVMHGGITHETGEKIRKYIYITIKNG